MGRIHQGISGRGTFVLRCAVIAAAAGGLAVLPAAAVAATTKAGPLRYVQDQAQIGANNINTDQLNCPDGTRLASLGFRISGPAEDVAISEMYPEDLGDQDIDSDDAAIFTGSNKGGSPVSMNSTATCLKKGNDALTYQTQQGGAINAGASVGTGSNISCNGAGVVGGGQQVPGLLIAGELRMNRLTPWDQDADRVMDDGWRSSFNISNSSVSRTPSGHAICIDPAEYKIRRIYNAKVVFPPVSTLKAKCPKPKKNKWFLIGGGLQGFHSHLVRSEPFDNKDKNDAPDDGWRVRTWDSVGGEPGVLIAHAICIKKK